MQAVNRSPASVDRGTAPQILVLMVLAAAVRLWLAPRYFGWEEGDYGNLMMIEEVLESGFTWFRASHMPGWYALGAVARAVGGDGTRWPALLMTLSFSVLSVGLAAAIARRVAGASAAWLVGLILVAQPEMALYGASTLRAPVYAALGLAGLWMLLQGSRAGFALTAASFLTRMEGFFVFYAPAAWTWWRERGQGLRSLLPGLLALLGVVTAWQLYLVVGLQERAPFWSVVAGQNIPLSDGLLSFVRGGVETAWHLLTWTLPRKVGWAVLALAGLGTVAALRGVGRPGARAVLAYAVFGLGLWVGEGFLAQHDPNHNLYWSWLLPVVPPLVLLAGIGWVFLAERLPSGRLQVGAVALALLSVVPAYANEVRYQMARSEAWYRPQLELARWLETHGRPGAGMVLGGIPEVWIQRQEHPFRVSAWWFLPQRLKHEPPEAFGRFLVDQRIDYLMWFVEEWTEAPAIAPYLADGQATKVGPAALTPVDREDGYGWILYVVTRPGEAPPPAPPAYGRGAPGPGWSGT